MGMRVCIRVIVDTILCCCAEVVFCDIGTVAVPCLYATLVATMRMGGVGVIGVGDKTLDFAEVGLDVVKTPAFCTHPGPLFIVGWCALGEHHGVHGATACVCVWLELAVVMRWGETYLRGAFHGARRVCGR